MWYSVVLILSGFLLFLWIYTCSSLLVPSFGWVFKHLCHLCFLQFTRLATGNLSCFPKGCYSSSSWFLSMLSVCWSFLLQWHLGPTQGANVEWGESVGLPLGTLGAPADRSDLVSLGDWGKAQVHSQQVRFFVFVFFFYFDEKSSVFFILVLQQIDTL